MNCEQCGREMALVQSMGDYVKLVCPGCAAVYEGMVFYSDMLVSRQPHCRATLRWKGPRATFKELGAVRQLLPELKAEPIRDLMARIGGTREWTAGTFLAITGERLVVEGERLGLTVVIESCRADER